MTPGAVILAAPGPSLPSFRLGEHGTLPDIIAITSAYAAVPRVRHVYSCDRRWWDVYRPGVLGQHPTADLWMGDDRRPAVPGVTALKIDPDAPDISRTPGLLHGGKNSGYQAINLAVLLGYTTLLLVGYDMRRVEGSPHYFGDYASPHLRRASPYAEWVPLFRTIRCDGFEVINCTQGSAIDAFPIGRLEDYL
jgi:hypothetical protein